MSVFKILDYRRSGDGAIVFEVELRSGDLVPGDTFYCYDTHHPVPYTVRTVHGDAGRLTLVRDGDFCYEYAFVDSIVDTTKRGRPAGFHYEGAGWLKT
jgi:hypothetical protein